MSSGMPKNFARKSSSNGKPQTARKTSSNRVFINRNMELSLREQLKKTRTELMGLQLQTEQKDAEIANLKVHRMRHEKLRSGMLLGGGIFTQKFSFLKITRAGEKRSL